MQKKTADGATVTEFSITRSTENISRESELDFFLHFQESSFLERVKKLRAALSMDEIHDHSELLELLPYMHWTADNIYFTGSQKTRFEIVGAYAQVIYEQLARIPDGDLRKQGEHLAESLSYLCQRGWSILDVEDCDHLEGQEMVDLAWQHVWRAFEKFHIGEWYRWAETFRLEYDEWRNFSVGEVNHSPNTFAAGICEGRSSKA